MDYEQIVADIVRSVGSANVIPIGIYDNIRNFKKDPFGSATNLAGILAPSLNVASSAVAALGDKPNASGSGNTPILAAALAVLKDMLQQCGAGVPDSGADFKSGAQAFAATAEQMGAASPPDSWTGSASTAYSDANEVQKHKAEALAKADDTVAAALGAEALHVAATRKSIESASHTLNGAVPVAILLGALPHGDVISYGFQVQTVMYTMPLPIADFHRLTTAVTRYAASVKAAATSYAQADATTGTPSLDPAQRLTVEPNALRRLSDSQHVVAVMSKQAGALTADTGRNVFTTHGSACAPTSEAVMQACIDRANSAQAITMRADGLAAGLSAAADWYDRTDATGAANLAAQMNLE
ncbi:MULTISPECIES: EspA/EspE family type VII secretion system effector [Mycobacteriaceae]|uniref:EspA/EspE family type VII secretion system effector n=1 Tax=Mycobacteriaceae TaxID=1762 RepID=UPI00143557D2|nr:EspA/EspE family type VII secretion system effector [Mycolicibacterium sp. NCC-Tsukiji]